MRYILIIVVLLAIGGGIYFVNDNPKVNNVTDTTTNLPITQSTTTSETATENASGTPKKSGFTFADIASHKDATSCWSAVNDKVYDLTSWIGKHPGGDKAILSICGKDGTANFMKKHADSEKAKEQLPNFLIGDLITQ